MRSLLRGVPGAPEVEARVLALARARFDHDPLAAHAAARELGAALLRVQAAADLAGRAALWLKLAARRRGRHLGYAAPPVPELVDDQGGLHRVVPWQSILDLLDRQPVFAANAEEVRLAYAEQHAFALAKAPDATVAARVQDALVGAMHAGRTVREATDLVAELGPWARSYAQTVVRTNATTAYAAGEFREAKKLEDAGEIGGLRFQCALDGDVRTNHRAAHGLVARVGDPVWELLSPPLGYNCRCNLQPVDALFEEVPLHARVPAGAHPDLGFGRGFGGRPDRAAYGGA